MKLSLFAKKAPAQTEDVMSKDRADFWGIDKQGKRHIYHPSDLVGKKGMGVWDTMIRRDAQVKNSYFLRRLCLLATARDIVPADENDPEAVMQRDFIDYCFKEMDGSIEDFIMKISDAIRCGFKVAEIVYRYIDEGDFAGKIGLRKLVVRSSANYEFEVDEHGNLGANGLIENPGGPNEQHLPTAKFVIWSYNRTDDDGSSIYGNSDFEAIYRYFYANDITHRMWGLACEKYTKPDIMATRHDDLTRGNPTPDQRDGLLQKLRNLHRKAALWIPSWATVEKRESPKAGQDVFREFTNWNNQMISKGMLLGTLIQQEGQLRGSYALGKKQFDLFYLNNRQIMRQIEEEIFLEQIIKRLIRLNFNKPRYPRFRLVEPRDPEETKAKAQVLMYLSKVPWIELQEDELREYIGFEKISEPTKGGQQEGSKSLEGKKKKDVEDADKGSVKDKKTGSKDSDGPGGGKPQKEYAELNRPLTEREKVVDFKEVARAFDQGPLSMLPKLTVAYTSMANEVIKQVDKLNIIENKDYSAIEKIRVNPGKAKGVYTELLMKASLTGLQHANNEVGRHRGEYAEPLVTGLVADLEGLVLTVDIGNEALEIIAKRISAKSFTLAGADADDIVKKARLKIAEAIEAGWTVKRFKDEIDMLALEKAQSANAMTGLRTAFNSAYNQARVELFASADDVVGHLYSSVLDDRTTEFCWSMDGKMWEKGDDSWLSMIPPNHFNCRSIIAPVMRGDEPAAWDTIPEDLEPAEGFGGPAGSRVRPAGSIRHPGYE